MVTKHFFFFLHILLQLKSIVIIESILVSSWDHSKKKKIFYEAGQGDNTFSANNSSDSDADDKDDGRRVTFKLDDWLVFKVDTEV